MPEPKIPDESLIARIEDIIGLLGYERSGGLLRSVDAANVPTSRHIVQQAFSTIDVHAVFGFSSIAAEGRKNFTPICYLAIAPDSQAAKNVHRLVWSQGVVPLLLIATPMGLEIRRSLAPPPDKPIVLPWEKFGKEALPIELTSVTSVALRSSIVWRDFAIDRSSRVDKVLLDGIIQLSETVAQQDGDPLERSVVHAVIGRFLYLYVLIDRQILSAKWVMHLSDESGRPSCPTIANSLQSTGVANVMWPAREVWKLFDHIDEIMNGAIFPISDDDRGKISDSTLHIIRRVIRHSDTVGPGEHQLSFLDITFATLRTETISAIYELFLSLESADEQSDDGAFYTPPFLVDFVLDEIDRIKPFGPASRVLDPAAGSGIFLVGSFRRVLERTMPTGLSKAGHFRTARNLLERSVFGIERNSQAANVCRFSLYLTLLDYLPELDILALRRWTGKTPVFPSLSDNIRSADIFGLSREDTDTLGKFTHVVGNPPWGSFGHTATRTNAPRSEQRRDKIDRSMAPAIAFHSTLDAAKFPVTNKRLSELFIWKIRCDFIEPGGALGILISTRSFVSRSAAHFPNAIADNFQLKGVANLSHFRYRLFAEARSPTIAVFALQEEPSPTDKVWVYAPLLSSQPIGEKGHLWSLIVNSVDVEIHRLRDLTRSSEGWFDHLILRPLDRRFARHIRAWNEREKKSLGDFLKTMGLGMLRGGSPKQTGLPEHLLLKSPNYRSVLGLEGMKFSSYPYEELTAHSPAPPFDRLFGGNVLIIPRHMNSVDYVEKPVAFSSSFNAIYFQGTQTQDQKSLLLKALATYLTSDVARYFYALTGRSWILDRARLEKNDLLEIPFPFSGEEAAALGKLSSVGQLELTILVAERLGLDEAFVSAVEEYRGFRSGYEDSQLPPGSLASPDDAQARYYASMLIEQLRQGFGSRAHARVHLCDTAEADLFGRLLVQIQREGEQDNSLADYERRPTSLVSAEYNPYSTVSFDARSNVVTLVKPWTQVAWTLEQAFTDARTVSAAILRSGAPS